MIFGHAIELSFLNVLAKYSEISFIFSLLLAYNNNNNSAVLLGANIHRPDAPLASQERKESEN